MAKKPKSRRDSTFRVPNTRYNDSYPSYESVLSELNSLVRIDPITVEDHRVFRPDWEDQPPRLVSSRPAGIRVDQPVQQSRPAGKKTSRPNAFKNIPSNPIKVFSHPKFTLECLRRSIRKEVLFAFNKTGKGGKRKPPRRTERSNIRC